MTDAPKLFLSTYPYALIKTARALGALQTKLEADPSAAAAAPAAEPAAEAVVDEAPAEAEKTDAE